MPPPLPTRSPIILPPPCQNTPCPPSAAPPTDAIVTSPPFSRAPETMAPSVFPLDAAISVDAPPIDPYPTIILTSICFSNFYFHIFLEFFLYSIHVLELHTTHNLSTCTTQKKYSITAAWDPSKKCSPWIPAFVVVDSPSPTNQSCDHVT